ncbi:MAG: hypothetical protein PHR06_14975, partial [Candidatus Cloacimonetes bacterium]|nr:hypothetical protein [Candidatus Cloacimonadota bacterium]
NSISKINSIAGSDSSELFVRVYKFVTLWHLTSNSSSILLSTGFLSYSLGVKNEDLERVLEILASAKKVRFNEILQQWELFEGSPINLEALIIKEADELDIISYSNILREVYENSFVYSIDHNINHEIERFGAVHFQFSEDYDPLSSPEYFKGQSDENIIIHIYSFSGSESVHFSGIHGYMSYDQKILIKNIRRLSTLRKISSNNYYILSYPNLASELEYEISVCVRNLSDFFNCIFSKNTFFRYGVEESLEVNSLNDMERALSRIFDSRYEKTLHVVNDQINMYVLSKLQVNSIKQVIDDILIKGIAKAEEVYTGSKPADLVYYSIIKYLPSVGKNRQILDDMNKDLHEYISHNPQGSLSDLLLILTSAPYGTRPLVACILLFVFLSSYWQDIMLFSNGNFIPSISSSELVDRIVEQNDQIKYIYSVFDHANREYLEKLESLFPDSSGLVTNKSLSIRVCSGMYNWHLSLPVITQQMVAMSISDASFLRLIASTRIDPISSLVSLMNFSDFSQVVVFKERIENHMEQYFRKIKERITAASGFKSLFEWIGSLHKSVKKTNRLAKYLAISENFLTFYFPLVENIDPTKWTKSSFEKLEKIVIQDLYEASDSINFSHVVIDGAEKYIRDVEISLKGKNTLENIVNTIEATRRYYTKDELEQMILHLLKKYIE